MNKPVCWLKDVNYSDADSDLQLIYDRVRDPRGQLDNLYRGFSLSPQTILPADDLYRAAMHDRTNVLAKVFSELIGTYVAVLSGCHYARAHHGQNFLHLSGDSVEARQTLDALLTDDVETCGTRREVAALRYVKKLCLDPESMCEADITDLREQGWTDAELSEIIQVVAMFSYFVRVINGVGISLEDEKLGLY